MNSYKEMLDNSNRYVSLFEGKERFINKLETLTPEQKEEIKTLDRLYVSKSSKLDWPKVVKEQWTYEQLAEFFKDEIEKENKKKETTQLQKKGEGKDFITYTHKGKTFVAPLNHKALCMYGVETWCVVKGKTTWMDYVKRGKIFFIYNATEEDEKQGRIGSKAWGRTAIYVNINNNSVSFIRASNVPYHEDTGPDEITKEDTDFLKQKAPEVWKRFEPTIRKSAFIEAIKNEDSKKEAEKAFDSIQDILDPNEITDDKPILWLAAKMLSSKIVKGLLEAGANPNLTTKTITFTPIFAVIPIFSKDSNAAKNIILLLAKHKADLNYSSKGWTPLKVAVHAQNLPVVEILAKAGADVNAGGKDGITPLFIAAAMASSDEGINIVNVLLQHGANKKVTVVKDGRKLKPSDYAENNKDKVYADKLRALLK